MKGSPLMAEKTFEKKGEDSITTSSPREQAQLQAAGYAEAEAKGSKEPAKTTAKPADK